MSTLIFLVWAISPSAKPRSWRTSLPLLVWLLCYGLRKHLVCSKIEIDGSILEKFKKFNYLGCELSLDGETGYDKKYIFQRICGTIRKHLKKTRTDTQMQY